jgi:hypothetical protein
MEIYERGGRFSEKRNVTWNNIRLAQIISHEGVVKKLLTRHSCSFELSLDLSLSCQDAYWLCILQSR